MQLGGSYLVAAAFRCLRCRQLVWLARHRPEGLWSTDHGCHEPHCSGPRRSSRQAGYSRQWVPV